MFRTAPERTHPLTASALPSVLPPPSGRRLRTADATRHEHRAEVHGAIGFNIVGSPLGFVRDLTDDRTRAAGAFRRAGRLPLALLPEPGGPEPDGHSAGILQKDESATTRKSLSRSFPDGRPLEPWLRLKRVTLPHEKNDCNDFPPKTPPVAAPSQPEPGAPDASPSLGPPKSTPAAQRGGTGTTSGPLLSSAANLNPRHTPAAAARSAPESPRTTGGGPPPPPVGRSRTWSASPPSPRS